MSQQNNQIQWKELVFVQYDVILRASYWAKDFEIEYESKFGPLRFGLHRMYMMPKNYTEQEIIQYCKSLWPRFLQAESFIEKNKEALDQQVARLSTYDSTLQRTIMLDWVSENVEDKLKQIMQNYFYYKFSELEKESQKPVEALG